MDTANTASAHEAEPTLEAALAELDGLVGLADVKSQIRMLVKQLRLYERCCEQGRVTPEVTLRFIFTGNPGTGKRTVALILARIFKCLGVVSRGQLIETDCRGLVGGYVGQSAIKTKAVVERALGGVLFIDEVCSLVGRDNLNYGIEAIEALFGMMEENRDNLVIILAGSRDGMREFLDSNPGIEPKFQSPYVFEDYGTSELLAIFERLCKKDGYLLAPDARTELACYFDAMVATKASDYANGWEAHEVFDKVVDARSMCISGESAGPGEPGGEAPLELTVDDVVGVIESTQS